MGHRVRRGCTVRPRHGREVVGIDAEFLDLAARDAFEARPRVDVGNIDQRVLAARFGFFGNNRRALRLPKWDGFQ